MIFQDRAKIVLELVHPMGYYKKSSETNNIMILLKRHAEPATRRIARQMQAQTWKMLINQKLK